MSPPKAEDMGSLGVMGSEAVPLLAFASSSCILVARLVSSRSNVFFSTVSSPGRVILVDWRPFAMAEAGNEPSLSGLYCFAKWDRIRATAADVSSFGMAGRRRKDEVRSSEVHLRLTTWFAALPVHAAGAGRLARVVDWP